ncbi:MAG TPA: Clp protease N-terminal domain-containing protein [Solirubrobacteraceae bacterium]|nr:Clp protease N-terminal domain-containing protein [Solirubrobacteraceae bacterium]
MFERFTRDAKSVVLRAMDATMRLGAEQVAPEHMLLALAEGDGPARRALTEAGLDAATIAAAIEADLAAMLEVVGVPPSVLAAVPARPRADRPDFSVHAKSTLEQAMREAVQRGERKLGPEHVLLGALRPPAPTLARVLARLDVEPQRLAALVELELASARR